jgi:small-conductance mechanosensitive channel
VTAAYGTDPDRVIEILVGVARKHSAVLADPEPLAVFDRFGDSAIHFTLFCWSTVDAFFLTRSELTVAVNNAFKAAGIAIPFPQQDIHFHRVDGRGAAAGPRQPSKDVAENRSTESQVLVADKGPRG